MHCINRSNKSVFLYYVPFSLNLLITTRIRKGGAYLGWEGGVPTLAGGTYFGWGTYLGWGAPTLAGSAYLTGRIPTLAWGGQGYLS